MDRSARFLFIRMRYRSIRALLDEALQSRNYFPRGKGYWFKIEKGTTSVVNLQKNTLGPGVQLNFGLTYNAPLRTKYPKEYECAVFGANPVLTPTEFREFTDLLELVPFWTEMLAIVAFSAITTAYRGWGNSYEHAVPG